jgi:hypothetical protein
LVLICYAKDLEAELRSGCPQDYSTTADMEKPALLYGFSHGFAEKDKVTKYLVL